MRYSTAALLLAVVVPSAASTLLAQCAAAPAGRSITGLPALNFDADEGMRYGALLQLYEYGREGMQPYRYTVQPTVFLTTRGRRDFTLFLDAPHLLPCGWRVGGSAASERQLATPYYGIGNQTVAADAATTGANPYYYRYGRRVMRVSADVQHDLGVPGIRLLLGAGARSVDVTTVPLPRCTSDWATCSDARSTRCET